MADIRPVTDAFAVAPQLSLDDMATAAALGFTLVINNRPDAESPDQPSAAQMETAARAAGMDYLHIPVTGAATPAQVVAMSAAIDAALADDKGKVLAFCRSGTRSIVTWSRGRAGSGEDRAQLIALGAEAGYDLSGVLA